MNDSHDFLNEKRVPLLGSERNEIKGSFSLGEEFKKPDPNSLIEISLGIRRKQRISEEIIRLGLMTPERLMENHGIDNSDFDLVLSFLNAFHLKVVDKHSGASILKVEGKLSDMERAFGVILENIQMGNQIYRQRLGAIQIPSSLLGIIIGVFGLDNRPQAQSRLQILPVQENSYTPLDIARLYNFPPGDGNGQTLALIELGEGFNQEDLDNYFASLNLSTPNILDIPVSGGSNTPNQDINGPDGEVMMDIEILGAIAPKAQIKVYFGSNTDKGFLDCVNAAIHDNPGPRVISISWGGPEENWTGQTLTAMEDAFQTAVALGILVTAASGDKGSTDGTQDLAVDFPASAPHALACGGTHLEGTQSITREWVWNDKGFASGGGVSDFYAKPDYQDSINNIPPPKNPNGGRGVPDVCGNADPVSGYRVRIDGKDCVVGGTSAVAPLWAGLISRISQNLGGPVPFLNPIL